MKLRVILLLLIILEMLFMFFGDGKPSWFPLANLIGFNFSIPNLTYEYIAYYFFEHLAWITASFMIWQYSQDRFAKIWFIVKCIDCVDFLTSYNHAYFYIGEIPVSVNTISVLVCSWIIIIDIMKSVIKDL